MAHSGAWPPSEPAITLSAAWAAGPTRSKAQQSRARTAFIGISPSASFALLRSAAALTVADCFQVDHARYRRGQILEHDCLVRKHPPFVPADAGTQFLQ